MSSLICGRADALRWQSLPAWEPVLFGAAGLRLGQWQAEGRVDVVKHGPHRTVYRVQLPEAVLYVKHRRCRRLPDAVGNLFRASSARREWRKAEQLARRGIATINPVAWQERVRGGLVWDSYLITEAVDEACSLDEYFHRISQLPEAVQGAARRRVIFSLATFTAALHRAGVIHNDLHLGNVLVRTDKPSTDNGQPDPPLSLYLLDLPGVRFSRPLRWPASRDGLVMLAAGCREWTSYAERWKFWQTYLRKRPELDGRDQRRAIAELDRGLRAYSRRVARRRDRRALRTNRDFVAVYGPGRKAHAVRERAESVLSRLMEDPEALLWRNLDRPVKLSHSALAVQAELPLCRGSARVIYKRDRPRNWFKTLLARFRRGRALRSWRAGHALLARGIATPRPLAACQVRSGPQRGCGYLATEWVEGAQNLHLYGWHLAAHPMTDRLRRADRCAQSLGALIGRMHAWGIAHGDLKGSNLLIVERDAEIQTYVIDIDDVRIARRPTFSRQAADLARLATSLQVHRWIPRTTVCRFFRAYCRQFAPGQVGWKSLWRAAARRSRRIVRRKRRRGEAIL